MATARIPLVVPIGAVQSQRLRSLEYLKEPG
jgi:hypothetical protein